MEPAVVFVPRDAAARSVGADEVADEIVREASARGSDVRLVRNGSAACSGWSRSWRS